MGTLVIIKKDKDGNIVSSETIEHKRKTDDKGNNKSKKKRKRV